MGHCIEVHRAGGVVGAGAGAVSQVQHPAIGQLQAQVVLGEDPVPENSDPVGVGSHARQRDGFGRNAFRNAGAQGRQVQG
ncbi:MAG: hypothetical protein EOO59_10755, partial [Hymenobacter sp.]